jgi:hypothetical protein
LFATTTGSATGVADRDASPEDIAVYVICDAPND